MRGAATIAGLELRRRLRDRSLVIQGVLAPLLMAFIITAAFGSGGDRFEASIAIADDDRSPLSDQVVAALFAIQSDPLRLIATGDGEDARRLVEDERADAAIVVPDGFGAAIERNQPLPLTVIADPSRALVGSIAEAVATGIGARIDGTRLAVATALEAGATDPAALAAAAASLEPAIGIDNDFGSGDDELDLGAYFGPSMAILFLFFTIGGVARSLLAERQIGTLARVRAAPVSNSAVLAGKSMAMLVLGLLSVLVLWAATAVLLGADWGDPGAVVVLSVATVVAVAGVGAVVAALARTDAQAESLTAMVAFTLALVGGNFLGPGSKPALLERLALLTPNGWALRGFTELSIDGSGLDAIVGPVAVLLAIGAVGAVVAGTRFRRVLAA